MSIQPISPPNFPDPLTDPDGSGPLTGRTPVAGEPAYDVRQLKAKVSEVVAVVNELTADVAALEAGQLPTRLPDATVPLDLAAVSITVEQDGELRRLTLAELHAAIPDATFILRG